VLLGNEWLSTGRLLFISDNGFLGLVPNNAESGDEIVLFFGAVTPFVLRRGQNEYYRLIGECYVYGIMNGEAAKGVPTELIKDFVLE
jgi:hypothetical protein